MQNYECLPGTPAKDFGPPWYCCIRSGGVLICEVRSSLSLADAERKAHNLAHSLMIASAAEEMCESLCGEKHRPNCPVDIAGGAQRKNKTQGERIWAEN